MEGAGPRGIGATALGTGRARPGGLRRQLHGTSVAGFPGPPALLIASWLGRGLYVRGVGRPSFSASRCLHAGATSKAQAHRAGPLDEASAVTGAALRVALSRWRLGCYEHSVPASFFPGGAWGRPGGGPCCQRAWAVGCPSRLRFGVGWADRLCGDGSRGHDRDHPQRPGEAHSGSGAGARCFCRPMTGMAMHAVLCGESKAAGEGCGRRRLGWRTWRSWRGTATCRGKDAGQGDCSPHARGRASRAPAHWL